jgi:hypothetical protein
MFIPVPFPTTLIPDPPEHKKKVNHRTRPEALAREEHYKGKTTE